MKRIGLVLLIIPVMMLSCKKDSTPEAVKAKFNEMYAGVEAVEWEVEGDSIYCAEFEFDGFEWEAEFKADGTWLETERDLEDGEMPEKALGYLAMFYPEKEAEYMLEKTPDGDFYEAEMEIDSVEVEVYFDMEGKMVCDKDNPVVAAFKGKYENAEVTEWKKVDEGFKAMFTLDGKEMKEGYTPEGKWMCTGTMMTMEEMPEAVSKYLKKMKSFTPEKFFKRETPEGAFLYVVGMIDDVKNKMKFDTEGNFLEMKEMKECKEEKKEEKAEEAPAKEEA